MEPKHAPSLRPEDCCFRTFAFLRASHSSMNSVKFRERIRFSEVVSDARFGGASLSRGWSIFDGPETIVLD